MQKSKIHKLDQLLEGQLTRDEAEQAPPSAATPKPQEPVRGGDRAEWIDIERLDDNPFQPRTTYDVGALRDLKASFDTDGQLQAAMARPHPTKSGRFQLAFGHNRKEAVRNGANAGIKQPMPHTYIGQLYVVVRPEIDDVAMLRYALEENDRRTSISAYDRARAYSKARDLVTKNFVAQGHKKAGDGEWLAPWREVAAVYKRDFKDMQRVAQLLELPSEILKYFQGDPKGERFVLNSHHGRALLKLQEHGKLQKTLLDNILEAQISGSAAEAKADAILKELMPTNDSPEAPAKAPAPTNTGNVPTGGQTQGSGFAQGQSSDFQSGSTSSRSVVSGQNAPRDAMEALRPVSSLLAEVIRQLQDGNLSKEKRTKFAEEMELVHRQIQKIEALT